MPEQWNKYAPTAARRHGKPGREARPKSVTIDIHSHVAVPAAASIGTVVNTHANGDHCYGNQLLAGGDVEFIASAAAAAELSELPASRLAGIVANAPPGAVRDFVEHAFGPFHLEGIEVPPIGSPFSGRRQLTIGSRPVERDCNR